MHVVIIPQKISSNEQSGFGLFAPRKTFLVKKTQTEILAKMPKNAKFKENWTSETTF